MSKVTLICISISYQSSFSMHFMFHPLTFISWTIFKSMQLSGLNFWLIKSLFFISISISNINLLYSFDLTLDFLFHNALDQRTRNILLTASSLIIVAGFQSFIIRLNVGSWYSINLIFIIIWAKTVITTLSLFLGFSFDFHDNFSSSQQFFKLFLEVKFYFFIFDLMFIIIFNKSFKRFKYLCFCQDINCNM